jgi:hypothetical protein
VSKKTGSTSNPAAGQPAGIPRWSSVVLIFFGLCLVAGCAAGPEGSVSSSGKYIIQGSIIARNDPDLPLKDNDVVVVNESTIKKTLYVIRTLLPIPSGS